MQMTQMCVVSEHDDLKTLLSGIKDGRRMVYDRIASFEFFNLYSDETYVY